MENDMNITGTQIYDFLDPFLIWVFRIPENPYIGFTLGLVWVALAATVIGELCMAGVYFLNKKHFSGIDREMVQNHNLSIKALAVKNKAAYKACNSIANEAFGKNFFAHLALFASSLWIVPFAIGWLSYRFGKVDFIMPWLGSVGPAFLFIPMYIVVRIAFAKSKRFLPVFRTIQRKIKENESPEELMSFQDLVDERQRLAGQSASGE